MREWGSTTLEEITGQDAPLEIEVEANGLEYRVRLRGELDLDTAALVREALADAELTGPDWIVVDLSGLEFIDSTGVQALLVAHRNARRNAHRLSFTKGGPQVVRVLTLCGLDSELEFV